MTFAIRPISFNKLFSSGDLHDRIGANRGRLDTDEYSPSAAFKPAPYDWPGDNEGRTMLAQVLLARASHREPKHLQGIIERLPNELNERGYFGRILPDGMTDEQQLAGNSWFLRALIEYYLWKGDPGILARIEQIVRELILPLQGRFDDYPSHPSERTMEGEAAGKLSERPVRNWYLSSDIGCAFILLDGATHAYELLGWPKLREVIEEMIASFVAIDLIAISAQTHATLSAARGLLRFYGLTGDGTVLQAAENVFSLYATEGMTENYANYNWFNRPWWTEPCAVIDAYLAAVDLWRYTKKPAYLEQAHFIYYNAMSHGQRHNGGFGCDNCSGATEPDLFALTDSYEAYWCCTMRGGEGLARAAQFSYWLEDDGVTLPFYHNGMAKLDFPEGEVTVKQSTSYPYSGTIMLEVVSSSVNSSKTVQLFVPSWVSSDTLQVTIDGEICESKVVNGFVHIPVELRESMKLEFEFDSGLHRKSAVNKHSLANKSALYHGPLVLFGCSPDSEPLQRLSGSLHHAGQAVYCDDAGEVRLRPVFMPFQSVDKSWLHMKKKILFEMKQ